MSVTPDWRYPICQLCGARHVPADGGPDGCTACSGPRVAWQSPDRMQAGEVLLTEAQEITA